MLTDAVDGMDTPDTLKALRDQHQQVSACFDEFLHRLFTVADQRAVIVDSLLGVITGIGMHFGFEEAVMQDAGYADFEHHRRQHLGIMTELGLLLDRLENNNAAADLARGADFLFHWYREHIANSDQALEAWLIGSRA